MQRYNKKTKTKTKTYKYNRKQELFRFARSTLLSVCLFYECLISFSIP